MKNKKKLIIIGGVAVIVIAIALILILTIGKHEHTWKEPTYDSPKTCSDCGETEGYSIKQMLEGEWRDGNGTIYLTVTFSDKGFDADMVVNGSPSGGYFAPSGTVEQDGNKLILWETNGNKYIYFTYEIKGNSIYLVDNDGTEWIKQ